MGLILAYYTFYSDTPNTELYPQGNFEMTVPVSVSYIT